MTQEIKLPEITEEERRWITDNPNADDLVDWINGHAAAAVEADRAQRGEPVAWMTNENAPRVSSTITKQCMPTASKASFCIPLYTAPQPAHTEAEVQQLMLCVADWDVECSQYEALVRNILGVQKP